MVLQFIYSPTLAYYFLEIEVLLQTLGRSLLSFTFRRDAKNVFKNKKETIQCYQIIACYQTRTFSKSKHIEIKKIHCDALRDQELHMN